MCPLVSNHLSHYSLTDFKALVFDVYGTLIDWESGIIEALKPLTDQLSLPLSNDAILEAHAYYESSMQRQTPSKNYSDLLSIVYKRLAEEWGKTVSLEDCLNYGHSVKNWPAFEDSVDSLRYLQNHYKLIVLSNVDNTSFAKSNKKLGVTFDAIYTAEDCGSYKPALRNFDYMLDQLKRLNIKKNDILHTAESMFHDHAPANKCDLANCWIYRRHDKQGFGATMNPGAMPQYGMTFNSMADMIKAHQEELAA